MVRLRRLDSEYHQGLETFAFEEQFPTPLRIRESEKNENEGYAGPKHLLHLDPSQALRAHGCLSRTEIQLESTVHAQCALTALIRSIIKVWNPSPA